MIEFDMLFDKFIQKYWQYVQVCVSWSGVKLVF